MDATTASVPTSSLSPFLADPFAQAGRVLKTWRHLASVRKRRLTGLSSATPVLIERESLLVKTIEDYAELQSALRLRHRVFHREYGIPAMPYGLDLDAYDSTCDHLVIVDRRSGAVIGTYRLLCSDRVDRFYSEEEFDLTGLLHLKGTKVELGRACIDPAYRNGATLAMLWRGILAYCRASGADTLFGCSSVKVTDPMEAARLVLALERDGHRLDRLAISPRGHYAMPGLELAIAREREARSPAGAAELPTLLQTYLKAGAKILGLPALDRDFHCIDLFTVLDLNRLSASYERRFSA